MASPSMPSVSSNYAPFCFHISGAYTASATGVISFRAPTDLTILYVTATIGAKSGTQGTTTLGILNAGTLCTNAMDLGTPAAGATVEATLVTAQVQVAKDALVTGDLTITGGSTPSISNITVVIWYQRRS